MRKIFFILILICTLPFHAQTKGIFSKDPIINLENFDKQRVYWGYFLGFNAYDFKIDYKETPDKDIAVKGVTGFNVGLVGDLRLHEYVKFL